MNGMLDGSRTRSAVPASGASQRLSLASPVFQAASMSCSPCGLIADRAYGRSSTKTRISRSALEVAHAQSHRLSIVLRLGAQRPGAYDTERRLSLIKATHEASPGEECAPIPACSHCRVLEWAGCGLGLAGASLLALNCEISRYGWIAFLAANVAAAVFAHRVRAYGLLLQQIGFFGTSSLGLYRAFWPHA